VCVCVCACVCVCFTLTATSENMKSVSFLLLAFSTYTAAAYVCFTVTCIKSEYTGMLALALRQLFKFCLLAGFTLSTTGFYRGCK